MQPHYSVYTTFTPTLPQSRGGVIQLHDKNTLTHSSFHSVNYRLLLTFCRQELKNLRFFKNILWTCSTQKLAIKSSEKKGR